MPVVFKPPVALVLCRIIVTEHGLFATIKSSKLFPTGRDVGAIPLPMRGKTIRQKPTTKGHILFLIFFLLLKLK